MNFEDYGALYDWCEELHRRLEEGRQAMTEEAFDAAFEGPFADILAAAMDVEDGWLKCEES